MNETPRTLMFVLAGVIALLIAWFFKPAGIRHTRVDDTGERFFAQFEPLEAKSMEIVTFDEASAERRPFKVAQVNNLWSIPSRENYPADAQDRLAKAASSVMDLTKGTVITDSPADHELYGVVDPSAGAAVNGVGTRVTLKDAADKALVDFVIGKAVKDAENLHYVREPNRDRVYTAKVATDQLSTKFEDWIERDLLKLDAMQIASVTINNYSIDEMNQRINRGDTLVLSSKKEDNTWSLAGPPELKPEEELNTEKLNAMRTALDDLKIVDVHRKPEGLAKQLQSEGEMKIDSAARTSLAGAGYYIVGNQLLSNEGETSIKMQDGVHYALRFGEVVNFDAGSSDASSKGDSTGTQPSTGAGRYLFVTADFDESLLEKPVYEPVPELPATQPTTQPEGVEGSAATQPDPALVAQRQSVIDANEQKRKDHEKKVADAQQKVRDLNKRFAEWYYVVGDDVYQKIKMTRAEVVQPKGQATTPPAPPGPNPFPGS